MKSDSLIITPPQSASFSERLKYVLVMRDLTVNDAAKRSGISQWVFQNLFSVGYNPTRRTLVKLAKGLNVTTDYLCGLTDEL